MRMVAGLLLVVTGAACAPLFSQNVGLAYQVKRGWSMEEVGKLMGTPALAVSLEGVEEWRYCSTRLNQHDEVVVLYFQGGQVIDRAFYSLDRSVRYLGPGDPDADTCRDSIGHVYTDRRRPPPRVLEIRSAFRRATEGLVIRGCAQPGGSTFPRSHERDSDPKASMYGGLPSWRLPRH